MRRVGHLFEHILDRDNMRLAVHKALKGKRDRPDVQAWLGQLESNLQRITAQLQAGSFPVGRFHQFVIHDPKQRIITAPCFEERVVHHAIMNVCEPYLDRLLVFDSYACRRGKGRIACLLRARRFAAHHRWFLKLDIRKYFDSIRHDRLLSLWQRRFKDARLFGLIESMVRGYRGTLGRGLPIGSLLSQHLANFYLGWYDRFVKEQLRLPAMTRYMDDVALWSDDHEVLGEAENASRGFLRDELDLEVKPHPYRNRCVHGMDYLGCRVFPTHLVLNRRSRVRFRRQWQRLERQHAEGILSEAELQARVTALVAFTRTPGLSAWQFRRRVLFSNTVDGREARTG
jgi:hypothetical protein